MTRYCNMKEIGSDHPSELYFRAYRVFLTCKEEDKYILLLGDEDCIFYKLSPFVIQNLLSVIDRKRYFEDKEISVRACNRGCPFVEGIEISLNEDTFFVSNLKALRNYLT